MMWPYLAGNMGWYFPVSIALIKLERKFPVMELFAGETAADFIFFYNQENWNVIAPKPITQIYKSPCLLTATISLIPLPLVLQKEQIDTSGFILESFSQLVLVVLLEFVVPREEFHRSFFSPLLESGGWLRRDPAVGVGIYLLLKWDPSWGFRSRWSHFLVSRIDKGIVWALWCKPPKRGEAPVKFSSSIPGPKRQFRK